MASQPDMPAAAATSREEVGRSATRLIRQLGLVRVRSIEELVFTAALLLTLIVAIRLW